MLEPLSLARVTGNTLRLQNTPPVKPRRRRRARPVARFATAWREAIRRLSAHRTRDVTCCPGVCC